MKHPGIVALLALAVVFAGCSPEEEPAGPGTEEPGPEPVVEERVVEILEGLSKLLRESKSYRVTAEVTTEEFLSSGQTVELSREVAMTVRRSGGVLLDRRSEEFHRRLYCDGETVSVHDVDLNMYATAEHPGTNDQLFDTLQEKYGLVLPLSDLAVEDPRAALSGFAAWGLYVGLQTVGGVECHHLVLSSDLLEWQVWVQAEGDPVPRKIVIIHGDEPGRPRYRAVLRTWEKDLEVTDEMLRFTPSEDATRVEMTRSGDGEEE